MVQKVEIQIQDYVPIEDAVVAKLRWEMEQVGYNSALHSKLSSYDWWNENTVKAKDIKKRREGMKEMYDPSEIARELFLSLPCKSLCRFRSISKQYHSYINDHQFMEEYRKRNMKPSHLLIWDATIPTNLHLFDMSMDSYAYIKTVPTYKYKITSPSLHGMVCLHKWNSREIALFNPSSDEIIPLPDCTEPFASTNPLGFGFEPKSRRYKIVQLIVRSHKLLRFHILTVTHNDLSWRPVNVFNESLVCFRCQPMCRWGAILGNMD